MTHLPPLFNSLLMRASRLAFAGTIAGLLPAVWACSAPGPRASPDWRDQIIYFVMTDRFDDGDSANNDQGAGEYKPSDNRFYSGGDFAGLQRRLDYIQGLGATALWITPPVANQWWDGGSAGYHGYWASHLKEVDAHLGTLADYRCLAQALHGRGMHLVQDVVPNHMGNFFSYAAGQWRAGDPARGWHANALSKPDAAPRQAPFHQIDPRDPLQAKAAVYHWTPPITNYADTTQEHNWQMSGLDDINTENPQVARALRDSYAFWLREVGVDALRVDTAFYVPPRFFKDWLHSPDPKAPGLARVAASLGRQDLLVFGEGFGIDKPFQTQQMRRIHAYQQPGRMNGMLNFPLYGSLQAVFSRGRPTAELAHRIQALSAVFGARQHRMPTFLDNHDVDRFLSGGSIAALRQSLLALFTLPGIPTIYYGTEQGFTEPRGAMFATGYGSGGKDHFNTEAPTYRLLAELAALRRENRLFSRGTPTLLRANAAGPGVIAWRTQHEGKAALVVMNTAETPHWLDDLVVGAGPQQLQPLFGLSGMPSPVSTDAGGRLSLTLPARSGQVWLLLNADAAAKAPESHARLNAPREQGNALQLTGRVPPGHVAQLVIDGDLNHTLPLTPDANGMWHAQWRTDNWLDPAVRHRIALRHRVDAGDWQSAGAREVQVRVQWQTVAHTVDPAGDDDGRDIDPMNRYTYPTDPSWGAHRQMDLRGLQAEATGQALRLHLQLASLTTSWNPANGFDHVAFTVFIELPGQAGGATVMPLQGAELPGGMRWHLRLRAHGWSNALFTAEGASADSEGTPHTPGAALHADGKNRRLTITLPAAALPAGSTLDGARVYVNTWDWDGGYRELAEVAGGHTLGGRRSPKDARLMDAAGPVTLRQAAH